MERLHENAPEHRGCPALACLFATDSFVLKHFEFTNGMISLEAANLQRTVRKLIRNGLVAETNWRPAPEMDDPRRRYYSITGFGREVLTAEANRMRIAVAAATNKKLIPAVEGGR